MVTAKRDAKFYLHVTESGIEQCPCSGLSLDQLRPLVEDRRGSGPVGLTRLYFPNPLFLIANDDAFAHTDCPVTAVINEVEFQGAFVVLAERSVDPNSPPLWGDMFLDGLTARECRDALPWIKLPDGSSLRYVSAP